jgi:hypothetical protein
MIVRSARAAELPLLQDIEVAAHHARCGFRRLADADLASGLRAIRAHEAARGLDRWPRAAMIRELRVGQTVPVIDHMPADEAGLMSGPTEP